MTTANPYRRLPTLVLTMALAALCIPGPAATVSAQDAAERPVVALLPLMNHTREPLARDVWAPLLAERFSSMPARMASDDAVRDVLRAHRIRAIGRIGSRGADALQQDLGADYAITGSYDIFTSGNACPEAALSLRLVDLRTLRVVWARSVGAACDDSETLFGLGRSSEADGVAARLIDDATNGLADVLARGGPTESGAHSIVVVPFEDIVLESPGSGIVTAHVLTHLVRRGFSVIEPGAAQELFLDHQKFPKGGIDLESLELVHTTLGAAYVLTGLVDRFLVRYPEVDLSFPSLRVSGRVIDAASGRIIRAADAGGDGDREIALGLGRVNSAADLTLSVTSSLLDQLHLKEGTRDVRP